MKHEDRELLSALSTLNKRLGSITLGMLAEGGDSLPPKRLRELAVITNDISTRLDNRADELEDVEKSPATARSVVLADVRKLRPAAEPNRGDSP